MIRIEFSAEDLKAINHLRYHHPHPRVQRKMEALWLKSQGMKHQDISRLTGVTGNTLVRYLKAYKQGGLEKIQELNFYQPQSELAAHREELEQHFREQPPATAKEAMATIAKLTGIKRSDERVRVFLKSLGLKQRKVGMIPAKADPEKQAQFKKKSWSLA